MTTQISQEPGLPAYKYPQRVEAVLSCREAVSRGLLAEIKPRYIQTIRRANRSPHILGQNRPEAVGYGHQHRNADYRRRVGLTIQHDAEFRQGLRLAGLCALLVAALCAWMFFNANFARP